MNLQNEIELIIDDIGSEVEVLLFTVDDTPNNCQGEIEDLIYVLKNSIKKLEIIKNELAKRVD